MATIAREKNGTVRIWFVDATGKRNGVRVGKVTDDDAERFKLRVEDLVAATVMNRSPRPDVVHWVEGLSEQLQDRLARVGLVEIEQAEPEPDSPKLGAFIDEWVASRHDVKPRTRGIYGRARHFLTEYLGLTDSWIRLRRAMPMNGRCSFGPSWVRTPAANKLPLQS